MAFIGRNGAGKTTTIKSMFNLVHPDGGGIDYFGMPLIGNEQAVKQRIKHLLSDFGLNEINTFSFVSKCKSSTFNCDKI